MFWLAALSSAPVQAEAPMILVFGDSLSAAYGMPAERGWVSLLQHRLAERNYPHRIVNASISGETTSGGLSRLPAVLQQHRPELVILELGANDGLLGQPPMITSHNLAKMIELSQQAGAKVLLAEMRIPPNYGPLYTQKFQATFSELANKYRLPLIPFMLNGVSGNPALIQDDGLHPRAEAQVRILENVWPTLEAALQ
jgi:acyl-CoA thioesterase-1